MPALQLAWAGLLGASLAAGPSLEAGVVAEGRARTEEANGAPTRRVAEGEVAPWIRLGLTGPDLDLTGEYRPQLTLTDVGGGARALLHQGSLLAAWRRGADWLASARVAGRTGTINNYQLLAADAAAGGPPQLVPSVTSLGYRALEGSLGLGVIASPRHRVQATLGAADEGGASLADQRWLPRQRRLEGRTSLEWDAGPHDVLASLLEVNTSEFSSGPTVGTAMLTETWRRVVSGSLRAWAGGGPALAAQRLAGAWTGRLLPAGEVGVGYEGRLLGVATTATVAATAAPYVDRVTGAVPQRIGGVATLAALPGPAWRLEGAASAARVMDGLQRGDQAWSASLQLGRSLGDRVELAIGARGLLQEQPRFYSRTRDWYGFLSVSIHTRRPDAVAPDPAAVPDPLHPPPPPTPEEQH